MQVSALCVSVLTGSLWSLYPLDDLRVLLVGGVGIDMLLRQYQGECVSRRGDTVDGMPQIRVLDGLWMLGRGQAAFV